ncbi:phage/plasmid primase, P4 family [Williamsia sp.]|uniref:phage/plasmid primase, P4 family n=1 Tax=Williamsia sp. TaxID=1872085 RepID=UPI001A2E7B1E|nr:phage/plasmid primase, P4 family [Williamsia sp.]MBJ7289401.1 bifunctional DNA primase/polymerase [Williamsia sp.]
MRGPAHKNTAFQCRWSRGSRQRNPNLRMEIDQVPDTNHTPEPPRTGNLDFLRDGSSPSAPEPVVPEDDIDFDPAELEIDLGVPDPIDNPPPTPSVAAPSEIAAHYPPALLRDDPSMRTTASILASEGFRLVPTTSVATPNRPGVNAQKNPGSLIGKNWHEKASANPETLDAWFCETGTTDPDGRRRGLYRAVPWSTMGIGYVVGPDHVVVDIDDSDSVPAHIWPYLDTCSRYQSTSANDSKRGHYVYRKPTGYHFASGGITATPGKGSPGEIRTGNSIAISAPTPHTKANLGRRYQWQRTGCIEVMPPEVAEWCQSRHSATTFNGHTITSSAADMHDLDEFCATTTTANHPDVVNGQTEFLRAQVYTVGLALHPAALNATVNVLALAAHDYCTGVDALTAMQQAFVDIRTDTSRPGNHADEDAAETEFQGIAEWALGRVRAHQNVDPEGYKFHVAAQAESWYGIKHAIPRPPGFTEDTTPLIVPSPHVTMDSARHLTATHFTTDGHTTLRFWNDRWLRWRDGYWNGIDEHQLRQTIYAAFEHARYLEEPGKPTKAWNPNRNKVTNVIDALRGIVLLDSAVQPPSWPTGAPAGYPAEELLALRSGLLHLPTRTLHPHTPAYFNLNSLNFEYDTSNTSPTEWLRFLESVWPDDPEAIATLQEWFGYVLSGRTDIQKMMLIQGPPRSGKGTVGRILTELIGNANVAGPSLKHVGMNFGLEGLIGKQLAIVADAHLSRSASAIDIIENLKAISGEDVRTVDRKNKTSWTGRFPTRFMIMANELLKLVDNSGALASRFIIITMATSFIGHEDIGLTDRLLEELPQILSWSLQGYDRVAATGTITEPASSLSAKNMLAVIGSPIKEFIDDCCTVAEGAEVNTVELHQAYTQWCADQEVDHPQDGAIFGKSLNAVNPTIKRVDRRSGTTRWRAYSGIRLGS